MVTSSLHLENILKKETSGSRENRLKRSKGSVRKTSSGATAIIPMEDDKGLNQGSELGKEALGQIY